VKRHFREMGIDTQRQDFTVIGIGDMAGDVFGNGMLQSRHIRLLAASIINTSSSTQSGCERELRGTQRLFDLPRSTGKTTTANCSRKAAAFTHARPNRSL